MLNTEMDKHASTRQFLTVLQYTSTVANHTMKSSTTESGTVPNSTTILEHTVANHTMKASTVHDSTTILKHTVPNHTMKSSTVHDSTLYSRT